jgi:hypothetical protein
MAPTKGSVGYSQIHFSAYPGVKNKEVKKMPSAMAGLRQAP